MTSVMKSSRSTIHSLVSAAPPSALRILDVNLRQNYFSSRFISESLAFANVLKLNDAELPQLAANLVAAFVCSQPGATPPLPAYLRQLFEPATSHA